MKKNVCVTFLFCFSLFVLTTDVFAHDGSWNQSISSWEDVLLDHNDADPYKGWATLTVTNSMEPPRRPQGHQAGHGHQAGRRPVRGRAPGAGADGPSEHRQGARCRRHRHRPALLRDGTGARASRSPTTATRTTSPPASGWSCSSRSARPSSTRTRRGSSTATSSPRTSWSRCTTACRCPR